MKEIPWLLQSWKMEKLKFDYHGGDSESAVPKIGSSSSPFTVEDRTPAGFPYWNRQPCHIGHRAWVANKGTLLDILLIRLSSFCLRRRCAGEPFIPAWMGCRSFVSEEELVTLFWGLELSTIPIRTPMNWPLTWVLTRVQICTDNKINSRITKRW